MPNHVHVIIILNGIDIQLKGCIPEDLSHKSEDVQLNPLFSQEGDQAGPSPQIKSISNKVIIDPGLPAIIRSYKSFSARSVNHLQKTPGTPVWQRDYYDHIIRNDTDLKNVWQYIDTNPQSWQEDQFQM